MSKLNITREQLLTKYKQLSAKISKIEESINNEETSVIYRTQNKYIPGIGVIAEVEDMKLLIKAHKHIKEQFESDDDTAQELGIELEESQETYLGFSNKLWIKEIKQRVIELKTKQELPKLYDALEIVKRNLSDDDIFNLEMGEIGDVLTDLSDDEFDEELED